MAVYNESQGVKPRELGDVLAIVNSTDTPLLSRLRVYGDMKGMKLEESITAYPKGNRTPRQEGAAAPAAGNIAADPLASIAQIFQSTTGVTQVAAKTRTATEAKGSQAEHQIEAHTIGLTRAIEGQCFSADDCVIEDFATNHWTTRGMFSWGASAAQTTLAVPAAYRPAAAQRYTGTAASFTEASFKAMAAATFGSTDGQVKEMDGYVGITIKQAFDLFTQVTTVSSTLAATTRYARPDASKYQSMVTRVEVSGMKVNLFETNRLLVDSVGEPSASTPLAGIIIDPAMWSIGYVKDVEAEQLGKVGGSESYLIEAIAALICTNPKATNSIIAT